MSNLIPEQRTDKNGKVVTRWIRTLSTGERSINIPAPHVNALKHLGEDLCFKLYPDFDENTGYLINQFQDESWMTYEFVADTVTVLPPTTLKKLAGVINDDDYSISQNHILKQVYSYLDAMYEHQIGSEGKDIDKEYEEKVRAIDNAIFFKDEVTLLSSFSHIGKRLMTDDVPHWIDGSLKDIEALVDRNDEAYWHEYQSQVNYSKASKNEQKVAVANIVAACVCDNLKDAHYPAKPDIAPFEEVVSYFKKYADRRAEAIDAMMSRGADNMNVLYTIMEAEAPSLSDGVL